MNTQFLPTSYSAFPKKWINAKTIKTMRKGSMLLFLLLCFFSVLHAQINLNSGLVAYFPFNENANDESGNNNNGVFHNASLSFDRAGVPNTALNLSNTSSSVSTSNSLQGPQIFAISLWLKTNSTEGKIFGFENSKEGTGSQHDRHLFLNNNGILNFGVWNGRTDIIKTQKPVNDNNWHHVIAMLSSNGQSLYFDGQLVSQNNAVVSAENYSGYWRIGYGALNSYWPSSEISVVGNVDDIRIYNRELNIDEIWSLFNESNKVIGFHRITPKTASINDGSTDLYFLAYPINSNSQIELANKFGSIKPDSILQRDSTFIKARFSWNGKIKGLYNALIVSGADTMRLNQCFNLLYFSEMVKPIDSDNNGFYNISSFSNLLWIIHNSESWGWNMEFDNDIDASESEYWYDGEGLNPITNFSGIIDGQGHKIKYLHFNRSSEDYVAFINTLASSGIIRNLGLTNCSIKGKNNVSSFVGNNNGGTISNCYSTGSINGNEVVGGLVGYNSGTIKCCYNAALVSGVKSIGGLVGNSNNSNTISKSYNIGKVVGSGYNIGGIIGTHYGKISDCYNAGSVIGAGEVAGVSGWNYGSISNTYNRGYVNGAGNYCGAMIGYQSGTITNSFWDKETSGLTSSNGGEGKTVTEMKTQSTYTNWDFSSTWEILSTMNEGYPQLTWGTNTNLIKGYAPERVANSGSATVTFEGINFDSKTKVYLYKTGQDTLKTDTIYTSDAYCSAKFNFNNAALGSWNILVEYPDTMVTIKNGLTVEETKTGKLKFEILGADQFRKGRTTTVTIRVTNTGNTTIENPIIHIAVNSEDSTFTVSTSSLTDIERDFCKLLNIDIDGMSFENSENLLGHESRKCKFGIFNCVNLLPYGSSELVLNIQSTKDFSIGAWQASYTYNDIIESIISNIDSEANYTTNVKLKSTTEQSCYEGYTQCMAQWMNEYGKKHFTEQELKNKLKDIIRGGLDGYNIITGLNDLAIEYSKTRNFKSTVGWFAAGTIFGAVVSKSPAGAIASGGIFAVVQMMVNDAQMINEYTNNAKFDCASKYYKCILPYDALLKEFYGVGSFDPNDKYGYRSPSGSKYFNEDKANFTYVIEFENKETATAAAQVVFVTDTLDSNVFDIQSFKAGSIKIGENSYEASFNARDAKWTIDMRPDMNYITYVTLKLDTSTGVAQWYFKSVDPVTLDWPTDPTAGFLPPNDSKGRGQGSVSFTINLKKGLSDETTLNNHATIVFDTNDPIKTPTWTNKKDVVSPKSLFTKSCVTNDSIISLQWQGSDEGSGVVSYSVYGKTNNDSYFPILENSPLITTTFAGHMGNRYSFYVIAKDSAENIEIKQTIPDITITLPAKAIISGVATVCQGQTSVVYSVPDNPNYDSYIWSLPSGTIGISSANSIAVSFSNAAVSGDIKVKGHNDCGDGTESSLAITVNNVPVAAGPISGNTTVCKGSEATYTVPAISGATSYIWSLPTGSTGSSTTNSITVTYGSSSVSGNITVKGHNECGDGFESSLAVTVNTIPVTAGPISGITTICQGPTLINYTVPEIPGSTSYVWTLPANATGSSTANNISVTFGVSSSSGNVTVRGHNECGDGIEGSLPIIVSPVPAIPVISNLRPLTFYELDSTVLVSSATSGNQWYKDGNMMGGVTSKNITVKTSGSYAVAASNLYCASNKATEVNVTVKPDNNPPVSSVLALPEFLFVDSVLVKWSGSDAETGIKDYSIFVSTDGSTFNSWLDKTTKTEAYLKGTLGNTYFFYSRARDKKGNIEAKSTPESQTWFPLTVNISKKWNDVLVCNNTAKLFTSYQWYKNDQPISGATKQFYQAIGGLNGSYYVIATTSDKKRGISNVTKLVATTKSINVFPNPTGNRQEFNVTINALETEMEHARLSITSLSGQVIVQRNVVQQQMKLSNLPTGIYIVQVVFSNGESLTKKLEVKY